MLKSCSNKYEKLDTWSISDILLNLFESQLAALISIKNILGELQAIIPVALEKINADGRLIFVGAGTSGRLAVQEAAELYPTFSWPKDRALFLIAGGNNAHAEAQEGAEDDTKQAQADFNKINITENDVIVCISASGKTPYTLCILKMANGIGAYTIGIACENDSSLLKESKASLFLNSGEEVIHGSTRMAAGTAQKAALNILTTTLMIKLNRVFDSHMVDLAITNKKLENRGIQMISEICNVDNQTAKDALFYCNKKVKLACVYLKYADINVAKEKLKENNNNLRFCLE